jgi:hypothetical protein
MCFETVFVAASAGCRLCAFIVDKYQNASIKQSWLNNNDVRLGI